MLLLPIGRQMINQKRLHPKRQLFQSTHPKQIAQLYAPSRLQIKIQKRNMRQRKGLSIIKSQRQAQRKHIFFQRFECINILHRGKLAGRKRVYTHHEFRQRIIVAVIIINLLLEFLVDERTHRRVSSLHMQQNHIDKRAQRIIPRLPWRSEIIRPLQLKRTSLLPKMLSDQSFQIRGNLLKRKRNLQTAFQVPNFTRKLPCLQKPSQPFGHGHVRIRKLRQQKQPLTIHSARQQLRNPRIVIVIIANHLPMRPKQIQTASSPSYRPAQPHEKIIRQSHQSRIHPRRRRSRSTTTSRPKASQNQTKPNDNNPHKKAR